MVWLAVLTIILFTASIIALAIGGAEPPHGIQTFSRLSPQEDAFEQRGARWRMIGFVSMGLAALTGLVTACWWVIDYTRL